MLHLSLALVGALLMTLAGEAGAAAQEEPSESADALSLVGLGDSLAGGQIGCLSPCRPFVEVYGDLASVALGRSVEVENLATSDGLESGVLLQRVQNDSRHREALAAADVITLMIGFNDWQGPCFWEGWDECFAQSRPSVGENVAALLEEIAFLREGQPTAVRVITLFDPYVGWDDSPGIWGFDPAETPAFESAFAEELIAFNAMLCDVADAHDAHCVDTRTPINGSDGTSEATAEPVEGAVLSVDHVHPGRLGHELIAQAIDEVGYAPLAE
jgi:lysophospholipase L1-like esterase